MTPRDEQAKVAALELLAQASAAAAETLEYRETLRRIAEVATEKFADAVLVYLYEDDVFTRHEFATHDSAAREELTNLHKFPLSQARLKQIIDSGNAWVEPVIGKDTWSFVEDPAHREAIEAVAMNSLIAVPMVVGGTAFGVLLFARVKPDTAFQPFEIDIAGQLANRAAAAIERSRIFMSEREQRTRLEHLKTLTEALATAVTIEATCDAIIAEMKELVGAKVVAIGVVSEDGKQLQILRTAGIAENVAAKFRTIDMSMDVPVTRAARNGQPVWLGTREEALAHSPVFREAAPDSNAWAAIPLMVPGRVIGTLGLSFRDPQKFPESDRSFILSMAHQTAQALERARLFESERTARREAEQASRAKDEFLAILSHELRTPLTTVLGWADLLKMTYSGGDDSIRFAIESLRASAATQARLIDDLLDVTRIITGKLSIEMRPCELTEVVRIAAESMRLAAETKGVQLEIDALCCIDIDADPARLHQMVTNLVGNATKFTPAGGRIKVIVRRRDAEADIIVTDTGIGISRDFLPHVFERFRQASNGDSRTHSGLGLGLSIVQHLAQLHGGSVRAESEGQDKGATFTVTLPVRPGVTS